MTDTSLKARSEALQQYIKRTLGAAVAQDMETADFIRECRTFWASYANAPVEVQNDAQEQAVQVLQDMDAVSFALSESASAASDAMKAIPDVPAGDSGNDNTAA